MNPSRQPDVSLYELAISSDPQPQPLQISPTTFKSLVGIMVDLLIEQQIPATIWLKLPRGEVWRAEIERFCQFATAPYTIYVLQTHQDNFSIKSPLDTPDRPDADRPDANRPGSGVSAVGEPFLNWNEFDTPDESSPQAVMVDERETSSAPKPLGSKLHFLPLSGDSQLKREYFLMVSSPDFYGLVLAHRPRSMRSKPEANSKAEANSLESAFATKSSHLVEENLEQKHPLLGLFSFDVSTIKHVLDGINQAICFGQPATKSNTEIAELLMSWEDGVNQGLFSSLNPLLVGRLLTKQIQRQEEIWRSGAVYRRQADHLSPLRQENEELLAALRQKDEFMKTLGQELRTPLTNMKTALSLLNSPHIKPPQRQRYMDMISRECDRQSSLITSVLDLVQIESEVEQTPMEPLRLTDLVPGVVSTYQPLAQEKGLMLGYTIPEDLPPVSCVHQWLKQIVINLLHNSIKFTPSGGQVWVKAKQQGNVIQIEFRDTGIGIAQSELPRIFDRFYRIRGTSDDAGGAGLGLSIVQQLLLCCGGSISVKSKPSEGSIFSVVLPIYEHQK